MNSAPRTDPAAPADSWLIRDAEIAGHRADCLVRAGMIAAVGPGLRAPSGAVVVPGRGGALLPGLAGRIETAAGIGTVLVEDPLRCVVRGAAEILERKDNDKGKHGAPGLRQ